MAALPENAAAMNLIAATATLPTTAASTAFRVSLGIVATVPRPGVGCSTGPAAGTPNTKRGDSNVDAIVRGWSVVDMPSHHRRRTAAQSAGQRARQDAFRRALWRADLARPRAGGDQRRGGGVEKARLEA